jgi:hypothetical protein
MHFIVNHFGGKFYIISNCLAQLILTLISIHCSQFGKVLENSNFLLVFIFVFSFSLATICFSFLISTFFSRANLAAACGGFIFFACFLPYNFLNLDNQDYSLSVLISSVSVAILDFKKIFVHFSVTATFQYFFFQLRAFYLMWHLV